LYLHGGHVLGPVHTCRHFVGQIAQRSTSLAPSREKRCAERRRDLHTMKDA
jgi:hypothetical protein